MHLILCLENKRLGNGRHGLTCLIRQRQNINSTDQQKQNEIHHATDCVCICDSKHFMPTQKQQLKLHSSILLNVWVLK